MSELFTKWGMDMTPSELGRWRRNQIHKFLALPDPFADVHVENKDDEVRVEAGDEPRVPHDARVIVPVVVSGSRRIAVGGRLVGAAIFSARDVWVPVRAVAFSGGCVCVLRMWVNLAVGGVASVGAGEGVDSVVVVVIVVVSLAVARHLTV